MPGAVWAVGRLPPDLSRSPGHAPVSTPLESLTTLHRRFASARLPGPHLTRSQPRLSRIAHHDQHLTVAAYGGLESPPAGRFRRTYLHHLHSIESETVYINSSFIIRGTRPAGMAHVDVRWFRSNPTGLWDFCGCCPCDCIDLRHGPRRGRRRSGGCSQLIPGSSAVTTRRQPGWSAR